MLKHLSSHDHFISFITDHVSSLSPADIQRLRSDSFDSALYKVQKINFDSIHGLLQPLYSNTGRPAKDQIEIFRSLLLMNHFGFTSIDKWVKAVASDHLYAILAGFDPSHLAPLGSYYAFMHRVWGTKKIEKIFPEGHHKKDPKNKKPASGQKWDNVPDGITAQLLDKYTNLEGTPDPDRPELILQELFNELALLPLKSTSLTTLSLVLMVQVFIFYQIHMEYLLIRQIRIQSAVILIPTLTGAGIATRKDGTLDTLYSLYRAILPACQLTFLYSSPSTLPASTTPFLYSLL